MDDIETIGVDLTSYEYVVLHHIARFYCISVSDLLSQFVSDLTESYRAGDSEERRLASDWLNKSFIPF